MGAKQQAAVDKTLGSTQPNTISAESGKQKGGTVAVCRELVPYFLVRPECRKNTTHQSFSGCPLRTTCKSQAAAIPRLPCTMWLYNSVTSPDQSAEIHPLTNRPMDVLCEQPVKARQRLVRGSIHRRMCQYNSVTRQSFSRLMSCVNDRQRQSSYWCNSSLQDKAL